MRIFWACVTQINTLQVKDGGTVKRIYGSSWVTFRLLFATHAILLYVAAFSSEAMGEARASGTMGTYSLRKKFDPRAMPLDKKACSNPFLYPNDCYYYKQTGLADFARANSGAAGIVVGYVSTGLNFKLLSLAQQVKPNAGELESGQEIDKVDNDKNGFVDDTRGVDLFIGAGLEDDPLLGLGTFAASVLVSRENKLPGKGSRVALLDPLRNPGAALANADEFFGLAPFSQIVPVKAIAENGYSTPKLAAMGVRYAVSMGARVVYLEPSFAVDDVDELCEAIDDASKQNILVVAPAGNTGQKVDYRNVPAGCVSDNLIVVAAANREGKLASFSSWGVDLVHLAAPGLGVYGIDSDRRVVARSGTNVAAALVTAAAALIWNSQPELTAVQVKQRLLQDAKKDPSLTDKTISGGSLFLKIDKQQLH